MRRTALATHRTESSCTAPLSGNTESIAIAAPLQRREALRRLQTKLTAAKMFPSAAVASLSDRGKVALHSRRLFFPHTWYYNGSKGRKVIWKSIIWERKSVAWQVLSGT
eukprot:2309183-Rhodomonas_salina.1